jgi:hypothetical protein
MLRVRRYFAPMSSLIAPMAGRCDVCRVISATVAPRHQVFCGALQRLRLA